MRPVLFEVFGYEFHSYVVMLTTAFLVCTLLCVRDLQRQEPPIDVTPLGGIWAFFGGLFGAKLFWVLQFGGISYLYRAVKLWEAGLVFYGGLIGGILAVWLYVWLFRLPRLRLADGVAPYLAIGEAITRFGCYLNGCCWGATTHVPWAICFPKGSYPYDRHIADLGLEKTSWLSMPVHPTQLYMTVGLLIAAVVMKLAQDRRPFPGAVGLLYCFLYGVIRFTVEMFRGDSARSVFTMTVSQTISLAMIVISAAIFVLVLAIMSQRAHAGEEEEAEGDDDEEDGDEDEEEDDEEDEEDEEEGDEEEDEEGGDEEEDEEDKKKSKK